MQKHDERLLEIIAELNGLAMETTIKVARSKGHITGSYADDESKQMMQKSLNTQMKSYAISLRSQLTKLTEELRQIVDDK